MSYTFLLSYSKTRKTLETYSNFSHLHSQTGGPKGWPCLPGFYIWYSKEQLSSPPTSLDPESCHGTQKFHPPSRELSFVPHLLPTLNTQ